MADNLIFPIGFDLQQAVEKAGKEWDKTYAKRLETYLAKRPVKVKLNFENLNDVKTRLAQLKIEPITPETKASIKELARELQVLAKALEQVQKYSKNPAQLGQQNFRNDVQLEKLRQANERLEIQKRRVALAEQKHAEAMKRSASASKQLSSEFQTQEGYVSRLVKRLAVYASFSAVSGLLTNIRQVTAEFELQRVSLGAIIQDQERANQLFGEIKSFALKSPVSILDLTKYTKQIAAYGVETEKLFDTTKMLTDVSVGLGTPLSQLALAFGQIRSQSLLRLAETRQLTEAGIPALELLAKQLEKTYGRFVSTAEVMELISKRAISFEMVEQMFKDMTSAGGAFYNMQEKQGNTLFGLWAKLGDAASVMYDEIGNTSSVNSGMKEAIRLLSDLMRNWRNVGLVVAESAAVFAIWKLQAVNAALVTNALTAAEVRALAVKKVHYKMQPAIIRGIIGETNARKLSIITVRAHAAAVRASATSTNIFTKAWYSLKAAFLSNPFGIALTALAAIATYLMFADDKVKRFKEDLDSIKEGGVVEATKSAYNFEQLAEKAVNAADGSMEQKDALDELQRTYKDMIPIQDLTIEKLKGLKGNYDSLTQSIKEYVYQRNLQQQIDRIIEERTGTMTRIEQKLRDELKEGVKYQVSDAVHTKDLGIDDDQISALFSRIKTEAKNTTKDVQTIIRESVDEIFGYLSQEDRNILYAMGLNKLAGDTDGWLNTLQSIIELQRAMGGEIENASTSMSQYTGYLGEYKKELDNITESVKKYRLRNTKGEAVGRDTFLFQQGQQNSQIKKWADSIKSELEGAGVTIQEGVFNLVDKINENDPTKISTIDFTKLMPMLDSPEVKQKLGNSYETFKNYVLSIQKLYDGIVPSDPIVQAVRNSMFAIGNATKGGMDVMKKYLWDGKGSIEDHLKTLKQSAATLESEIYKYSQYIKLFGTAGKTLLKMMGVDVDALSAEYDALTKQIAYVQQYVKETDKKDKGGTKSDPRLQTLQEIANKMAEVNKEYDELLKKEGQTKALADTQKLFASSFAEMQKVANKYKFKLPAFEVPQTIEDVQKWYDAIIKEINRLGIKNADKVLIELGFKSDKAAIDKQQKEIESELKRLSDRISRTKTAREFYEKILRLTRNEGLAFQATFSVYGKDTLDTFTDEVEQLKQNFGEIDITAAINLKTKQIDYKKLREIWDADKAMPNNLRKIPQVYDSAIKSILDAGDKLSEKQLERWGKDLERAREYADKRIELAQYTATQIADIEAKRDSLDPESKNYAAQVAMYDKMISGYREREKNEAAKLDYEQIKEQIGMFDDLGVRIGTTFESILNGLREYTQSPDFARLGLEAQKNVYQQIAKIEDRMAEGFQGIGVGTVSEYVRQYSTAASEYLTAQNNLRDATLRAIEADKEWERVKNSNDEAAKSAALAEKTLADSRVRTAAASVNAAGANMQRAQEGAARASAKFDSNLQKVESSLKALNNGALKALWDLIGDKGKRSVGEFLSGSRKILSALDKLTKALADSGSDMGQLSTTIATNLAAALQNINPDDTEAIARAATESLKTTLSSVISDKGVVDLLANTLSKNIGEIASQALSGVLSTEDAANKVGALIDGVADAASKTGEMWGAIISLVLSLLDEFAENGIGTFLGELLDNIADAVEGILANLLTDALPKILGGVGNVVKGVGVGLADMLTFGVFDLTGAKRIKRANKEIKRQQELLEQLEYTYGRLEAAADKLFGRDYVNNYNQQLKNLQAQQQAYLKQAEAERSKGKKKDEDKIKEYEEQARETADKIKELQDDLVAHFTGSTKTDVARQMAKSWVDARASMSDTFAAIKGNYQDMIKNMIVEGAAARVIENALTPVWDSMDKMLEKNDVQGAIDSLIGGMDAALTQANNGMEVLWKALEARGYDMKKLISDTDASGSEYSGIAKSVAGATSEEINNVAAIGNTLMYYASPIPRIDENLARVVAIMEGKTAALPTASGGTTGAIDYTDMFATANQHLSSLPRMEQHLSEIHTILGRIITTKGGRFGVKIYM